MKPIVLAMTGAILLAGCATGRHAPTRPLGGERLGIAVGACYGTCPVYAIEFAPDGAGRFDGKEHVAALGQRLFRADVATQGELMAALADYRPATGTVAQTRCEQQVSDQPSYVITWTAADGRTTTLNHDGGCLSAKNERLNAILTRMPDDLRLRPLIGRP